MDRRFFLAASAAALGTVLAPAASRAQSIAEIGAAADETLALLRRTQPVSEDMIRNAKGILIFPRIVKGGLLLGGAGGRGVLRIAGRPQGHCESVSVSFGLQAGVSRFGYVMFFMDEASLAYVRSTDGWEIGVGPNVTVADEGVAKKLSTTTAREGVYVFFVGQKGFFAGMGLEGTKITRIAE